ncbi:MAG TPA: hypothetical protein PKX48_12195 [Planctomycetota bacterium]|jgi:hypothetical protein|nr:hypothetical protein [Planctomycetota bacterium]OQC20172.1 MAG: hypothetical protein BWX69_02083 [Planctomycetes bacterium ADurb.Bin069]NMD35245.1 hypothetical protein [Planctomycetota bacterium]HNR99314.1 hypothetical protein [Planctomycetota bacterium]HNU26071.1 hypothetical protein [Planctomycetota bacterium]
MKPTLPARAVLVVAVLSLAFPAAAADAAPSVPLAAIAPRGTLALVEMPALKVLWEEFQAYTAPAFADDDLRKAWAKLWEGKWERDAREIFGMQPLDLLLAYPTRLGCILGDLTPVIEAKMEDETPSPNDLEIGFCIEAGKGKEEFAKAFEQFLEAVVKHAAGKGREFSLRREKYHDAPYFIATVPPDAADAGKNDESEQINLYAGWAGAWLVLTPSKRMLEKIFDVHEGAPALRACDGYRAAEEALGWKSGEVALYADVRGFLGLLKNLMTAKMPKTGDRPTAEGRTVLDILDLFFGEITTAAFRLGFADKTLVSEYFVGCDRAAEPGLLHILGRKEGLSFPGWTWSGDGAGQACLAVDAKHLQKLVPKLLSKIYAVQFDPSMADAWRGQFSAFFMGLDLEKDLLGTIGERLTLITGSKQTAKAGAEERDDDAFEFDVGAGLNDFLIALELQKTEPWETMLGQMTSTITGGTIKKSEYMERTFFVFVDSPSKQLLGGVSDGMLLVGTRDMIEQAVRRFGKDLPGLNDNAGLKELAAGAPGPNAWVGYQAQGSLGVEEIRALGGLVEENFANEVPDIEDVVGKELAESVLGLVREVLKEKRWSDFAPRSFSTASWEAGGLRVHTIERGTKPKAAGSF